MTVGFYPGFYSLFFVFSIAFGAIAALSVLNQAGILNLRASSAIAVVVVLPLMCGIVLLFMLSLNQMGGDVSGGVGMLP